MNYAHTKEGLGPEHWQRLEDHLRGVADLAAAAAGSFGAEAWGQLAGLWHDLGKYSAAYQDYLQGAGDTHQADLKGKVDHSTAGAQHAVGAVDVLGHLLAYVIAGHHSGLLDGRSDGACLEARLKKNIPPWQHGLADLGAVDGAVALPAFLQQALRDRRAAGFPFSFFTRMLYSCLVDADFLDTEQFMAPERAAQRPRWSDDILQRMEDALRDHVAQFPKAVTTVDRAREAVRGACLAAASGDPGFFSLTVPTGGGKTLSSLAFALRHAKHHGLARVVYVIPFTSIIEQNADVFRTVMAALPPGDDADPIIEHHSNLDVGDVGDETVASRLATENWAAPLVVTTSVQFYESLFACRSSRCRKLHNLARSVIILDEVQTLPVDYLAPCLAALRELVAHYGSTVVLCTATQPAVTKREGFDIGLSGVREIVPDPQTLYTTLKRVQVDDLGQQTDEQIAARVLSHDRVLCIVNTRRHARLLFESLGDAEGHYHLSALMCPEHRGAVLDEIRARLVDGLCCRVISTQLVEAGVDIDFPVVLRSLAGIDSIAQAAGRCNRNGTLAQGHTFIFRSEHTRSESYFRDTAAAAVQVLAQRDRDPLSLDAVEHFFRLYYWDQTPRWDHKQVLGEFRLSSGDRQLPFSFNFASVDAAFQLIEDAGRPVIVPWKKGRDLCDKVRNAPYPSRRLLRRLQRYTVQVPFRIWNQHVAQGSIEVVRDRYPVLASPELHYSERLGLVLDDAPGAFLNV